METPCGGSQGCAEGKACAGCRGGPAPGHLLGAALASVPRPSACEIVHSDPKTGLSACKVSWFLSVTCGTPMGSFHGEIRTFRVLEPREGLLGEHSHHGGRLKLHPPGQGPPMAPHGGA